MLSNNLMHDKRQEKINANLSNNKTPKILQLGKFYPPHLGGIERVMEDICDGINAKGLVCDCLVSNKELKYKEDTTSYGAKIFRVASFGILASTSLAPQMIIKLFKIIKNYDIIHVHHPDPMATLALFLVPLKNKIIITHYHSDIFKNKWLLKCFMPLQNYLLKRSQSIVTTSDLYAKTSLFLKPYQEKITTIPIGIPPIDMNQNTEKTQNIVCSVGRLVPLKGFEYLIESALFLPNDFSIHIAGDGDIGYKNKLLTLIKKHCLEDRVFLVGRKVGEELNNFYAKSRYFVLPSMQESFGIVLLEAMRYSIPCICTNLTPSGMPYINLHNQTGKVVEKANSKAIAKAILEIQETYEFYANNAKKRFLEHFTQQKMIESFNALYKEQYECQKKAGKN
ncbi:glycosyltransferase [Helicobacter anatolicus]|uniref:glycosyltransferase n=1 Tax=Helicobacter anatolicus TaxID=2905874 RepID=UPI001E4FBAE4|nr:glycosyltransferase [Helicobacter anatolicus]MCE3039553.1 glycosyltransferase [Helicobacter anatolicus]